MKGLKFKKPFPFRGCIVEGSPEKGMSASYVFGPNNKGKFFDIVEPEEVKKANN